VLLKIKDCTLKYWEDRGCRVFLFCDLSPLCWAKALIGGWSPGVVKSINRKGGRAL